MPKFSPSVRNRNNKRLAAWDRILRCGNVDPAKEIQMKEQFWVYEAQGFTGFQQAIFNALSDIFEQVSHGNVYYLKKLYMRGWVIQIGVFTKDKDVFFIHDKGDCFDCYETQLEHDFEEFTLRLFE